jgi:hypothetical protein
MNYNEAFHKTIQQSFDQYHKDNPHIYAYFCQYALDWIKSGAKKISSKQIIGRIRWHLEVDVQGEEASKFKINDIYSAHYARLFVTDFPEYEELLEFRHLRAA